MCRAVTKAATVLFNIMFIVRISGPIFPLGCRLLGRFLSPCLLQKVFYFYGIWIVFARG
jgi:hypothetical protein